MEEYNKDFREELKKMSVSEQLEAIRPITPEELEKMKESLSNNNVKIENVIDNIQVD